MTDLISRKALVTKLSQGYWDWKLQQAKNDPCVIDAMIDWAIRIVNEMPLESPWHTGTPTEDGYYLCHIQFNSEDYSNDEEGYDIPYWFKNGSWEGDDENVRIIAWRKIEPYKEKEK